MMIVVVVVVVVVVVDCSDCLKKNIKKKWESS